MISNQLPAEHESHEETVETSGPVRVRRVPRTLAPHVIRRIEAIQESDSAWEDVQ